MSNHVEMRRRPTFWERSPTALDLDFSALKLHGPLKQQKFVFAQYVKNSFLKSVLWALAEHFCVLVLWSEIPTCVHLRIYCDYNKS